MSIIFYVAALAVVIVYTAVTINNAGLKFGTYSNTYYLWKNKLGNPYPYYAFFALYGLFAIIGAYYAYDSILFGQTVTAIVFLELVVLFRAYKSKEKKIPHYIAAVLAAVISIYAMYSLIGLSFLVFAGLPIFLYLAERDSIGAWNELFCFYGLPATAIIHLVNI